MISPNVMAMILCMIVQGSGLRVAKWSPESEDAEFVADDISSVRHPEPEVVDFEDSQEHKEADYTAEKENELSMDTVDPFAPWRTKNEGKKKKKKQRKQQTHTHRHTGKAIPSWNYVMKPMTEEWTRRSLKLPFDRTSLWAASHHAYEQNQYRLQKAVDKLLKKQGLTVLVMGGSVTAGMRCDNPWPTKLQHLIQEAFPDHGRVQIINKAVPATTASYALPMIDQWLTEHPHVDIIITEYEFNERMNNPDCFGNFDCDNRERTMQMHSTYDEMLSIVMASPSKPAFIFLDVNDWYQHPQESLQENITKSIHYTIAKKFAVPIIWYPDAVRASGELQLDMSGDHTDWTSPGEPGDHPKCFPGHCVMASVVFNTIYEEIVQVSHLGVQGSDFFSGDLKKDDSDQIRCYTNPTFKASPEDGENAFHAQPVPGSWSFYEDRPGKPGWIAEPGAQEEIVFQSIPVELGTIEIEFLRSYEGLGTTLCKVTAQDHQVLDACETQTILTRTSNFVKDSQKNTCEARLEGLWETHVSQATRIRLKTMSKGIFDIRCKTDQQKFKILGLYAC
eukprot:gnl/MRDRNA2_/MRDRNA2_86545_c0_seq2.p1 gnl/MRDRNA2_/MRDRNA2_86545_c0~~gnl/MRDRNA2_/MRDRNA2_86545_c0_seq2.p1  ORF type:complete len:562 (+),score=85.52 gnl/MRDRNA2_/MRDRNA2_86545_c0_seq2:114-1799(+)